MPSVEFHPEAQAELTAATEWYLERSVTAAANFVAEVEHAVKQIGEAPLRYPQTLHGRRRFVLLNFPYDLVYRMHQGRAEVIAVAHHHRRPGYWRQR